MEMTVTEYNFIMGSHKEWRRIAKRERRRRIRIQKAKERDYIPATESNEYQNWLKEQELLEIFESEQIEKVNEDENEKWLQAEKIAIEQWKKLLEIREKLKLEYLAQEAKLKLEWEMEQKKKKEDEERLREIEEEKKIKHQKFLENLEEFLSGTAIDPPDELMISRETKPNSVLCPFFLKTACCRFGDQCSRNHQYPGISKVLLATNFYIHFGIDNANCNEYDTDLMLEYEDTDTYKEFKEFYYDVLPEFQKFGTVVDFKVCNNHERHLRGNTYVEFAELRCAVSAYRALHARWYGGRQLSLEFCNIRSWSSAICGLQLRRRCPKGRSCNFLHVYRNPDNSLTSYRRDSGSNHYSDRTRRRTSPRSWRWSESPEPELPKRYYKSSHRSRREQQSEDKKRKYKRRSKEKKSTRSRSRS